MFLLSFALPMMDFTYLINLLDIINPLSDMMYRLRAAATLCHCGGHTFLIPIQYFVVIQHQWRVVKLFIETIEYMI